MHFISDLGLPFIQRLGEERAVFLSDLLQDGVYFLLIFLVLPKSVRIDIKNEFLDVIVQFIQLLFIRFIFKISSQPVNTLIDGTHLLIMGCIG